MAPNLFNLIQDINTKTIDSLELWLATQNHNHQTVCPQAQDWTVAEKMAEVDLDCSSAWSRNHQSSNILIELVMHYCCVCIEQPLWALIHLTQRSQLIVFMIYVRLLLMLPCYTAYSTLSIAQSYFLTSKLLLSIHDINLFKIIYDYGFTCTCICMARLWKKFS